MLAIQATILYYTVAFLLGMLLGRGAEKSRIRIVLDLAALATFVILGGVFLAHFGLL